MYENLTKVYENLTKNDYINVFSYISEYEFFRVFFVKQDSESITIYHYLLDENIKIPKKYIAEIGYERKPVHD